MKHWFTRRGATVDTRWLKRFDPHHWTVDFPRGSMASLTTGDDPHRLEISLSFLRKGDLAGLIWSSEDLASHPAHARETRRDYRGTTLAFRWQSTGLAPLDAINSPTLTIEGRDADGSARSWYVRLWNYARGSGSDARIELDFDALDAGFMLPSEAVRVFAGDIDRMFISLVPPDYVAGSSVRRSSPAGASVTISDIRSEGPGSVIRVGDAVAPENGLWIASSYDDQYNLTPARLVESFRRSGFRGGIVHYVGMSHYPSLGGDGLVDADKGMCAPALAWHRSLAHAAKAEGYDLIWSLSYELLEQFCPADWKQRDLDGHPALTGWEPPSTLLSPANAQAMAYLQRIAKELVGVSLEAGLEPKFQVGEPWWWTDSDGRIYLYDAASVAALGGAPAAIADIRGPLDAAQCATLDAAGALLASSTAALCAAVREVAPSTQTHLLAYLPTTLDPARPEARRANLPIDWASPAFDRLQVEDYDWLASGRTALSQAGIALVEQRLGYGRQAQHYMAGFVARPEDRAQWADIIKGAQGARERGVETTILWAWPQVARDGLTLFGEEEEGPVQSFADEMFPLAIGQEASVSPSFSTNVITSAGGHEIRNANWQSGRLRFDAGPGVRGEAELQALIAFFRARRGPAVAFRFRDPFDFSSAGMAGVPTATDQLLGVGDGTRSRFDLIKTYADEQRRITRPEPGSVRVAVGGNEQLTGWTLEELGQILFDIPPPDGAEVSAGFLFDVPTRFEQDALDISRSNFLAGEAPSVPLIEVREA